jgi:hypothetical protein
VPVDVFLCKWKNSAAQLKVLNLFVRGADARLEQYLAAYLAASPQLETQVEYRYIYT